MFTGIVESMGKVVAATATGSGRRLAVDAPGWAADAEPGESISVSGVCLTAAGARGELVFDIVAETLARTALGRLRPGSRVNLERCVRASTPMGGHIVQGHVEGLARVESILTSGEHRVRLRPPGSLMEAIIPKGSITLDGVSLTLAAVDPRGGTFEVALIPTTLERTTLGTWQVGDEANVETDIVSRSVSHWLAHYAPRTWPARRDVD